MKALLWKPFRKWSSDIYTGSSRDRTKASAAKASKAENSRRDLTSQDPIVDSDPESNNGNPLDSMDFGKNGGHVVEQERDLEKAIQQNHSTSTSTNSNNDRNPYDPTEPKLQISK